jgi:hypothetical protein
MFWSGIEVEQTVDGDEIKQTQDGEELQKNSPDKYLSLANCTITGSAVFENGELHPDSHFTANGTVLRPAEETNNYTHFEPTETGGKIYFAQDESVYDETPAIHFSPSESPNRKHQSWFLSKQGLGKVKGRDDDGHLVDKTTNISEDAAV